MSALTQRILKWRLVAAAWLLFSGCGDDGDQPSRRRTEEVPDAAAPSGEASAGELESTLTGLFGKLDSATERNGACYVQMGAYASVEECVMWQASRPEWIPCTASFFADHPEGVEVLQCLIGELQQNSECLATKPCEAEARAECDLNPLTCVDNEAAQTLTLALATRCPDISLLPRLAESGGSAP